MRLLLVLDVIHIHIFTLFPTGLGQGDALADEGLLDSWSLGSSTDDILIFFVDNRRRL